MRYSRDNILVQLFQLTLFLCSLLILETNIANQINICGVGH